MSNNNQQKSMPQGFKPTSTTPDLPDSTWTSINSEAKNLLGHHHHALGQKLFPIHEISNAISNDLCRYLASKEEFREEFNQFHSHPPPKKLEDARKQKKFP